MSQDTLRETFDIIVMRVYKLYHAKIEEWLQHDVQIQLTHIYNKS